MKTFGLWVVFLLLLAGKAPAQISVEVTQEQDQFLPGETLMVAVRITNRSGQDLHLGLDESWLSFAVESMEGEVVPKQGEAPVAGEFVLESSKVATKQVDLAPYFGFSRSGRFSVTATVRIKEWDREVSSRPKFFNILEGSRLWEQEVGVPGTAAATNSPPEVRRYMLQQANYLKGQIRLYLRITDSYGRTFRVFPIGPMVSFGRPEPQVDKLSNLHVLYQNRPHSFGYFVFNIDGELLKSQTYDYIDKKPRLKIDDEGVISVTGGTRRVTPNDVPPPPPGSLEEEATNAVPVATNAPPPSKKKKSTP